MREALQEHLHALDAGFLRMHSVLLEQLALVRQAVQNTQTTGIGAAVKELDAEIDQLETDLENRLLSVIALQQPVARDLKLILLILKSLSDLERAGDYAAHIARNLEELSRDVRISGSLDLLPLLTHLSGMVERAAYAFIERDANAARDVIQMDDGIDAMYEQLQRASLTRVLEDPRLIGTSLQINTLARSVERLADHLVNVAERLERTFGSHT